MVTVENSQEKDTTDYDRKCMATAVMGPCTAFFRLWAYNFKKGQCEQFIYGGCGGTENQYRTKEKCEMACKLPKGPAYSEFGRDSEAVESPQLRVLSAWYCSLPAKTGPYEAAIGRFFYNVNSDTCEDFLYGGCEGNRNNFRTYEQCHAACHPRRVALARA
ncbi:BPTI/Kunitz domain-containing protein-like [Dermacentor andersoni]|uniref:BPTI/Kunitz domain-containing protein-like n=1 Tax=Dermacentor andersoni TaxID=34620 RepID=UPI002417C586|nr:actinia tenebrosa protease inhibitors-like [Dermacentor andersoni]